MKRGSMLRRLVHGGEYTTPAGKVKAIAPWRPITAEESVEQVDGMKIKDLTGPYVYTFSVLGRAVGVSAARGVDPKKTPKQRMRRAVRKAHQVMFPGQEAILDARKNLDTVEELYGVGRMLQGTVKGEALQPAAMRPFLDEELMGILETIVKSVGPGVDVCRRTAYGTVVAAGRKLDRSISDLIYRMLQKGLKEGDLLDALQRDALGDEFCFLPEEAAGEEPGAFGFETVPLVVEADTGPKQFTEVLTGIKVAGQPVFRDVRLTTTPCGSTSVSVLFLVSWKPKGNGFPAHRIQFEIPKFERVTPDGHGVVTASIGSPRFFRPRFSLEGDVVAKQGWKGYITGAIVEAVSDLTTLKWAPNRDKTERRIQKGLRDALKGLCESDGRGDVVNRVEYVVVVPDTGGIIADWQHGHCLLAKLAAMGFDVLSTSKGEPGSIVTRAGKLGIPDYMLEVNVFSLCLDPKRRPETREIKDALPLAYPMPLAVRNVRGVHAFTGLTTELWTAWFDCNANVFTRRDGTRFAHDTILATKGAMKKLAIKSHRIPCHDAEDADRLVEEIRERFGESVTIRVKADDTVAAPGLIVQRFLVEVEGVMEDCGKIKAAGTAIKAIPNVLPLQLHAVIGDRRVPIDIVVPRDTAFRKKDLSALFRAGAGRLGITEIDPETFDPKAFLETLEEGFEQECGRKDGKVPLIATYEDGREEELGLAYVGPLPYFRPPQTNFTNFKLRKGKAGISLHVHSMVMVGDCQFRTPASVQEQFAQVAKALRQAGRERETLKRGGSPSGSAVREPQGYVSAPAPEEAPAPQPAPILNPIPSTSRRIGDLCPKCGGSGSYEYDSASGETGICYPCNGTGVRSGRLTDRQIARNN